MKQFTTPRTACEQCNRIADERDELIRVMKKAVDLIHNKDSRTASHVLRRALDTRPCADVQRGKVAR